MLKTPVPIVIVVRAELGGALSQFVPSDAIKRHTHVVFARDPRNHFGLNEISRTQFLRCNYSIITRTKRNRKIAGRSVRVSACAHARACYCVLNIQQKSHTTRLTVYIALINRCLTISSFLFRDLRIYPERLLEACISIMRNGVLKLSITNLSEDDQISGKSEKMTRACARARPTS